MDRSDRDRAHALSTARALAAVLAAGPVLLTALAPLVPPSQGWSRLVVPVGVLGIVAPALAWRLQARIRESVAGGAAAGRRAYLRSLVLGLGVTEAAALLGVGVWLLAREVPALVGLPMHLVMAAALWPTEQRLQAAEEAAGG
jgi:hypothetical protein